MSATTVAKRRSWLDANARSLVGMASGSPSAIIVPGSCARGCETYVDNWSVPCHNRNKEALLLAPHEAPSSTEGPQSLRVLHGVLFGKAGQQRRQAEVLAGLVEKCLDTK